MVDGNYVLLFDGGGFALVSRYEGDRATVYWSIPKYMSFISGKQELRA